VVLFINKHIAMRGNIIFLCQTLLFSEYPCCVCTFSKRGLHRRFVRLYFRVSWGSLRDKSCIPDN